MKKKLVVLTLSVGVVLAGIILLFVNFSTESMSQLSSISDYSIYYHGDFKKAFNELLPLAKSGNTKAQVFIANLYSSGLGVHQDHKKAFDWYTKAAKENAPGALVGLALMYQDGSYVKKDDNKAIDLYEKAVAVADSAGAKYNLAFIYLYGKNKNLAKGLKLLQESAEQNFSAAQGELGKIYYFGKYGQPIDYREALDLTEKAANSGDPGAQNNLALMYLEGKAVKQNYQKAYKWFYIAENYGGVKVSKSILDSTIFNLTDEKKVKAEAKAKEWMKTHKEINFSFVNRK